MEKNLVLGVDLGGTNLRIALGDDEGHIISRLTEKTEKRKGSEGISEQVIRMIYSVVTKKSWIEKILGIGIGSSGPLDLNRGGLMKPTNMPFEFVPLVEPLENEFEWPTYLLNDCSSAVMGEKFFGAGKSHENLAYVTLSTGIGGGVYVDGNLLIGKDGNAAEIGHFTVDFEGRLLCGCGKRGHWEAYCSGEGIPNYAGLLLEEEKPEIPERSLLEEMTRGNWENATAKILFEAAKAGDQISLKIVEKIGILNAMGFACVVDAYDPSLITVGGSMTAKNMILIIDPIRRHVNEYSRNRVPEITMTPLGDDVVLLGALAMVFHPNE